MKCQWMQVIYVYRERVDTDQKITKITFTANLGIFKS